MKRTYKITAINYADKNFTDAQRYNSWTAKYIGRADIVIAYGPNDIDLGFKERNSQILAFPKGGGYWLWKPYFIYKTLRTVQDGEYVFYLDSGCIFMKPISVFTDFMQNQKIDLLCFSSPFLEKSWDKNALLNKYINMVDIQKNDLQFHFLYKR